MRRTALWALTACLALAGCAPAPESGEPATPFNPVLDDRQLMNWVLDPMADVIWGSAGSVITVEGEQDLAPVDDAGWAEVRNAAATIAESGNLLMLPGRSQGADWNEFSAGIVSIGERAVAAAEAQDADALFDIGGQLYNVCVACHQIYMLDEEAGEG